MTQNKIIIAATTCFLAIVALILCSPAYAGDPVETIRAGNDALSWLICVNLAVFAWLVRATNFRKPRR